MYNGSRKGRDRMMGFLDNLEAYIDFAEDIDKDPELEDDQSSRV